MEQQLAAGLGEREIAEFVEDDEVHAGEIIGDAALPPGAGFGFEPVDEIDGGEEPATGAGADAVARDGDGAMAMARWLLPVPVPPMSTALRCSVRKAPPARLRTSASLIGVSLKTKSSISQRNPQDSARRAAAWRW
jgi:hypothetical protein